jgi:hypothetical protein
MAENEDAGIELLLSQPEIVAWLELDKDEDDDGRRSGGTAPATGKA